MLYKPHILTNGELTIISQYDTIFTTVKLNTKRETSHFAPSLSSLNPGIVAEALKTQERLWMAVLLLAQTKKTPIISEFAKISGLSFGFISKFSNILRQANFLAQGRGLKLLEPGRLLDIVRDLYFFEVNRTVSFYTQDNIDTVISKLATAKKPYALTRMCGAAQIAPFVRYQLIDFYIPDETYLSYWKKHLSLVDVELTGNINLVIPQNPRILNLAQTAKNLKIVNNVQLYLDLYKYPARGREQAEFLREKILKI